jgi:cell division protease FtsH
MSTRLRDHLLYRLRHVARLKAVENAIEHGILAVLGDEPSSSGKDSARRIKRPAVEDDDDRFRRTFASDLREERQGRVMLGPTIKGRRRHEVARILARHEIALPPAVNPSARSASAPSATGAEVGCGDDQPSVAEVWQTVRRDAPPPQVDEIAVMLLLVAAIQRAGLADGDWHRVLRHRDWTATILSPVDGFELRIVRMLREGAFGHAIGVYDGYEMRADMTSLPSRYERRRSLIVFRGKEEDSHAAFEREQQTGFAARLGVPVVGIADDRDHLPLRLRQAASLRLDTGPLNSAIIGAVLHEVIGALPDDRAARLTDDICAALSLHDLAVAIRPGRNADEVIATLLRLAGASDGQGSSAARGRTSIPGSGDRSGSDWGKGRNGRTVSSGSEIIKPVASAIADPSAGDVRSQQHPSPGHPSALSIETLHGYGTARQWALDLKQDLALWRSGSLPWSQMSTKLLLSGPPGTGKTTFAKALCNTLQVPLLATSVSTWLEPSHLGDVIKRMRISFEEARKHAPAILFVDEIDGIGKRGQNDEYDDYWNSVVNKLLELLDGSGKTEGLIIVGATNHPDVIDPALLRSGRLETRIEIPLPDVDALVGILAHHLGNDCPSIIATRPEPSEATTSPTLEEQSYAASTCLAETMSSRQELIVAGQPQSFDAPTQSREAANADV